MERLTERTSDGIIVKEDYGENVLKTLYSCYGGEPMPHYANCEEGYCTMEKLAEYEDLQDKLDKQFDGHVSMAMIIVGIIENDKQSGRDETVVDAMMLTNENVHRYREWKSLEEQGRMMKLPIPVGGTVYEKDFPMYPNRVIGYRIGRMMDEAAEDYEEGGYDDGEWHIEYARSCLEFSVPVSAIGEYIFLTREEAEQAQK